jgi:DNA-binding transcriptional MerR regulator
LGKGIDMTDTNPIYNLKAVVHEVGLSAATLRAWERRYGLLKPQRSPGGHRLYSKQDIEMLKWLVERQNEGLSISRAVEMWKTIPRGQIHPSSLEISTGEAMLDELREQWIIACTVFDDQAANRTLDQAFALATPETICTEVLQKGLAKIGEGWYAGSISVQQEHFASAIAIRRINSLLAAATPPTRSGHILAACPPGEEHDFALLVVTYFLRRGGWDVVYLGSNVPLNDLDATIQSTRPALILSAAQTLESAASLRQMSEYLVTQEVALAFGGGIFIRVPATVQSISGYYLGTDMAMLSQNVELLVTSSPSMPKVPPISFEYTQILGKFQQNEISIISFVTAAMQSEPVEPAHVEIANSNLTRLISSVLILGDINLLDPIITWLNGLLENHGLSVSGAMQFYAAYQRAVERYLGEEGAIIRNWLSMLLRSV